MFKMNVVKALKNYLSKMIEDCESGMKILLMDKETTSIVSIVYTQSEIMQKEVYLLERIDLAAPKSDSGDYTLSNLKCVSLLRPTAENITLLSRELRSPSYSSYYLYFTNVLAKADVKKLAESDEQELVKDIQEFYLDYLAIDSFLFSIGIPNCIKDLSWEPHPLNRTMQALMSVLLSLKKSPIIRYQKNSNLAKELGFSLRDFIIKEASLFENRESTNVQLFVIDRRNDPLTPLLNQWTYQAMIHELLELKNNRVFYRNDSDEKNELVLSAELDDFYSDNMYATFGELGRNVKEFVNEYQLKVKSHQKVDSIADLNRFMQNYPQFKKMTGNVSKHVNLMSHLMDIVNKKKLLTISELEQKIVSENDHSSHLNDLKQKIVNLEYDCDEVIRLVLIYALKYENHSNNDLIKLINLLMTKRSLTPNDRKIRQIIELIEYGGKHARQNNMFNSNSLLLNDVSKLKSQLLKGLKEVDYIYAQHEPHLMEIINEYVKGSKAIETDFPVIESNVPAISSVASLASLTSSSTTNRCKDIIIFYVGGCTYEEALHVHRFNETMRQKEGFQVLLGSNFIHNSTSYLSHVHHSVANLERYHTRNIRNVPIMSL